MNQYKFQTVHARLNAERCAIAYLSKLPSITAFATAIEAEAFLAQQWAKEQAEMMERGDDTRETFPISNETFERIRQAREMVPPGVKVDLEALHHILSLVGGLQYLDDKWRVTSAIAFRQAVRAPLGKLFLFQPTELPAQSSD